MASTFNSDESVSSTLKTRSKFPLKVKSCTMHCTTTKGDMKAEWLWYAFSLLKIEGVIIISDCNYYSSQTPSSHSMQYELRVRNMNALYNLSHKRVGVGGYESRRQVEDFQLQTVKIWIFFFIINTKIAAKCAMQCNGRGFVDIFWREYICGAMQS